MYHTLLVTLTHALQVAALDSTRIDSIRLAYDPRCQIGICPPRTLVLSRNSMLRISGPDAPTQWAGVAMTTVDSIWASATRIWGGRLPADLSKTPLCSWITTHKPTIITTFYVGASVSTTRHFLGCGSEPDREPGPPQMLDAFTALQSLEHVMLAIPNVTVFGGGS